MKLLLTDDQGRQVEEFNLGDYDNLGSINGADALLRDIRRQMLQRVKLSRDWPQEGTRND